MEKKGKLKNINLVMIDVETGLQANNSTKKVIYESFKPELFEEKLEIFVKNHLVNP